MTIPAGQAVELEQSRLQSIISVVFEDAHYSKGCSCEHCTEVRKHLGADDLAFINHIARVIGTTKEPSV